MNSFLTGLQPAKKETLKISVENGQHKAKHTIKEPIEGLLKKWMDFKQAAIVCFFPEESQSQEFLDDPFIALHSFTTDVNGEGTPRMCLEFYHMAFFRDYSRAAKVCVADVIMQRDYFRWSDDSQREPAENQGRRIRFENFVDAYEALSDYVEYNYEKILETRHSEQLVLQFETSAEEYKYQQAKNKALGLNRPITTYGDAIEAIDNALGEAESSTDN